MNKHTKNNSPQPSIVMAIPVGLFGSVMGLTGLTLAYRQFAQQYAFFNHIATGLSIFTLFVFTVLTCLFVLKWIFFFEQAKAEFQDPMTKSFFATITISLLLLPLILNQYSHTLAFYVWIVGVTLSWIFAIYMLHFWIETKHIATQLTPAWVLPVVGTLNIPPASVLFHGQYLYILNLTSLSIGIFFAIPLITLIFSRIVFIEKLPSNFMPTLIILVAPFSVAYLAYAATFKALTPFSYALFSIGVFIFLGLLPQLMHATRMLSFKVIWWAISFPIAAMLNSMYSVAKLAHQDYPLFAQALLMVTNIGLLLFSLIILFLIYRTAKGIIMREVHCFC
ncbi:SLAC1 anion channel family protein [Actinobacillus delphinicola]|uniref:Putative inner membrane transport protein n=1 Tax=Actinobacillus delphinicola TaxID=51161 RepID=A0A448TS47_9PAST|nr:SLAC1 anion channel family protein [Actinobacillus delphinicola]VEJ08854.1 putative inner membrane transport protein [Actinobacillus delphinicola]